MSNRYRNLYDIFKITALSTDDVERLVWWSKGSRAGYQGYGHDMVPVEFAYEYMDGVRFGGELFMSQHSNNNGGHY